LCHADIVIPNLNRGDLLPCSDRRGKRTNTLLIPHRKVFKRDVIREYYGYGTGRRRSNAVFSIGYRILKHHLILIQDLGDSITCKSKLKQLLCFLIVP